MTTDQLEWSPPGPGSWELLADHYPRPITAAMEPFGEVWSETSTEWMIGLGLPIRGAHMATVNGLPYINIDTGAGRHAPPAWVMRLVVKLVPNFRRAERRLQQVLDERPWVEAIDQWYRRDRPAAVARMLHLGRIDLTGVDDEALADHIRITFEEVLDSARQHLALHAHDIFPPGLFVVRAMEVGLSRDEALGLLTGSSPASAAHSPELESLRAAVAQRPATSLDELRRLGPEVADALEVYLRAHGPRLVEGYDIDARTTGELPGLVTALATRPPNERLDHDPHPIDEIDAEHRAEFDDLLTDARAAYGVRDDNSGILTAWPAGLLRLAILEAGRRLVAADRLESVDLALEGTVDELVDALRGSPLDVDTLSERAAHRRDLNAADAPRLLGPPSPPAPSGLPGALGRVFRVLNLFEEPHPDRTPMTGVGIGDQSYTGTARVITAGTDADQRFEPGDVLIAPMTSPSYNVLLAIAGGLVTEEGGHLSHAAIMARELSLPAVIGAAEATRRIHDGDLVAVDPAHGSVKVVQSHDRSTQPA